MRATDVERDAYTYIHVCIPQYYVTRIFLTSDGNFFLFADVRDLCSHIASILVRLSEYTWSRIKRRKKKSDLEPRSRAHFRARRTRVSSVCGRAAVPGVNLGTKGKELGGRDWHHPM